MIALTASDLSVSFGGETLFDKISFALDEKGRAGLVGVNGCGKTTLFRILTGKQSHDTGGISMVQGTRIGYMEQYVIMDDTVTLYDEVLSVFSHLMEMERELQDIAIDIDTGDHSEKTLTRQMQLQEKFESEGGLYFRALTTSALMGLGFEKELHQRPMSVLSGGQKSKAQLAKLLLSDSNLLLLDEPTNHLDIKACEWLEKFLLEYKGAYIVISHDRYFLDKVTNTTFEMENGHLREYKGNYSRYLELKEEYRKTQQRVYERTLKEISRIEGMVEQQKRWGQEHNYITAASKQKQADRLKETLDRPEDLPEGIRFTFRCKEGGGNDVLMAKNLSKSFDDKLLFSNVELDIKKNTRVFILGENGCGKTTLLKILTGETEPDSGQYRYGAEILPGYYDQVQANLTGSKTVLDEVWDSYPKMTQTEVRSALAAFLFKGEDVFKTIANLSGGEKARVALLKLMLKGANLLLLDEPTNHLDIHSRQALEEALLSYGGTLVIVSHDRYLINKLADRIILLKNDGTFSLEGNYDRYLEWCEMYATPQEKKPGPESKKPNLYKEKKERDARARQLRAAISKAEREIEKITEELEKATALLATDEYATDYEKAFEVSEKIEQLRAKEEQLTEEWMTLSEELETVT